MKKSVKIDEQVHTHVAAVAAIRGVSTETLLTEIAREWATRPEHTVQVEYDRRQAEMAGAQ